MILEVRRRNKYTISEVSDYPKFFGGSQNMRESVESALNKAFQL